MLPVLATDRLVLRIPPRDDAPAVAQYLSRNRVFHAPWSPIAPEGYYQQAYWSEQLPRDEAAFYRGEAMHLVLYESGDPVTIIGRANFSNIVRGAFQACYLGYDLDERVTGRGYMTEALRAATGHAFSFLGLHRIMANYIPTNERSANVLRRLGFKVEGYARDYLFIAGRWQDHVLTALVRSAEP